MSTDYSYVDYLSFSGEGYSMASYSISDETLSTIINNIENSDFDLPKAEDKYSKKNWAKTPLAKKYSEVELLATSYSSDKEKLTNIQKKIKQLLNSNNNYHSFYYREVSENIIDIELFIIDVEEKKIYYVSHSV
ncbi:hypothetical protein [uncultured Dokdonia sp.]|uniref:hypothetical protein n=1 Tax=uncultured Dokdonia sp. TaxID=575653 RepID=UPI0026090E32|nr:hypothetical protein [uncultured Dokdonia sp.]